MSVSKGKSRSPQTTNEIQSDKLDKEKNRALNAAS